MKNVIAAIGAGAVLGAAVTYIVIGRDSPGPTPTTVVRDISDVPRMTAVAAEEHREDRYQKLYSIEQILALPSDFAETEALYVLAGRSDSGSVQNLIYEADRIADPTDRGGALSILFSRLSELDSPSALAMARSSRFSSNLNIEANVWRSWGRNDLAGALEAARSQSTVGRINVAAQALYSAFGYMGNATTDRIERELGVRPDRTSRARFVYNMADRSPEETIRFIEQMDSGRDQQESVSWLAYHLSRSDVDHAPAYADLFENPSLRDRFMTVVGTNAAAADPRTVLDRLLTSHDSRPGRSQVYSAMRELVAQDIDSALVYYDQIGTSQDKQALGSIIAEEFARKDPVRAIEWARDNERANVFSNILAQVALSDPQLALEEAKNIEHGERRRDAVTTVMSVMARTDAPLAATYVGQISGTQDRNSAAASVFSQWAQTDPEAALHWLTSSELDMDQILQRTAPRYMMTNMDAAMRILPHLDEEVAVNWRQQIAQILASQHSASDAQNFINQFQDKDDFDRLRASVIQGLAQNDIRAAQQIADQMPAGRERDESYAQLVAAHANVNPVEASTWLASIGDSNQRRQATSRLVSSWYLQDPDVVTRWINNLADGAQRDDAIVNLAGQWHVATPSQRFMMDSIGDPAKKKQAHIAQVYAVARRDGQSALSMLDDMNLSPAEQLKIQKTIERYRNR